jgi:hypothetical protein
MVHPRNDECLAWLTGLPLIGVADFLDHLHAEQKAGLDVWSDFGKGWIDKFPES